MRFLRISGDVIPTLLVRSRLGTFIFAADPSAQQPLLCAFLQIDDLFSCRQTRTCVQGDVGRGSLVLSNA